jgi:hypothetical protein
MKRILAPAAYAVALSLCLGGLIGCGSSSSTPTPPPIPSISSFVANPATITAGASATLTGVFVNGTGVITPGNLPATSGTAVTVSPTATTTYTLTVTPSSGAAVTATATITVNPAPTITSFTASPTAILAGGSSSLTAVFANGTGMIEPGDIAVTSGTAVSVSPAATTTYTLTVTPPAVGTAITQTATVTVYPPPTITSFLASPSSITAGGSGASLTADFSNGTGVITPGNITVTSGTPVNVGPTTTTTYTLTVTPPVGTAITATASVTVDPAPTITSFVANPTTVGPGGSSSLTAVFANGTGVSTPGNLPITSGVPVSVSPTTTTIYTLTVTNPIGSAISQITTVTYSATAPAITTFVPTPATIAAGGSSSLLADFVNGTGMITPGNIPVTSGTAVNVSPASTTTYTLTVTPTSGTAITQTTTVTVVPAPTITSFGANPATIALNSSSSLTAVFANGTGVITPGNLTVTSGTPVSVSPTTTTIYTLTVTPTLGAAITQTTTVSIQSTVSVNESSSGPAVTDQILGMNLAAWYDVVGNATAVNDAFAQAGIQALRWPGGSWSDEYHWQTPNSSSNPSLPYMCANNSSGVPNGSTSWGGYSTFEEFVTSIVQGGNYDLALTADYGTDAACTGPGQPSEAAAWVAAAVADGITVSHVTVGNEEYGTWETDLHTPANNAATYAAAVAGSTGYYSAIKNACSGCQNTLVGVSVNPGNSPAWDPTVLANAPYDFVEYHFYPETPGEENDTFLVQQAAQELTANINTIKSELNTAGKPNTPIYVGEIGGAYSNPGKQSWSITQGLYAGQVLGEMMNAGVSRLTWWIGFGNCNGSAGNDSSSLYGWQDFGAYNVFSDGPGDTGGTNNSPCDYGTGSGSSYTAPIGTMSPTARAFQLFSNVAVNGESVLTATVAGDTNNVRAYAATHSGGTALVLFNLNENANAPVTITLSGLSSSSGVTVETYDKAIYDMSNPATTNTWAPPVTVNLGPQSLQPLTLSLAPWSMNVVIIQ